MRKLALIVSLAAVMAACRKEQRAIQPAAEPETISVTNWTEKTELFLEHPPLVAGQKVRFAVHLTDLRSFQALAAAEVTVELEAESFRTPGPSRPGIFGVDVQPRQAGTFLMAVEVRSPGLADRHELGKVQVYGSAGEAPAATGQPEEATISFLKEQQWSLDFATERAAERSMRESLEAPAQVRPRSGGEAEVTAPVSGRLDPSGPFPVIGAAVSKGETLASLIPAAPAPSDLPVLELAVAEARTALELARKDRGRVERLVAVGAVPARRLDEARAAEETAAARWESAQARLAHFENTRRAEGAPARDSIFLLRSPIAGVVAEVKTSAGANVQAGESPFRIVAVDTVYVVGSVPEREIHRVRSLSGAEIAVPGLQRTLSPGRLVTVGRLIDPESRTLSVVYEVANRDRRLAIGQAVSLRLFTSGSRRAITVSEEAVVDDGGRPVVFVQVAGESFARRPVRLGSRESGYVQVLDGLERGDRVVSRGAYLVRLAAVSNQRLGHGHVH